MAPAQISWGTITLYLDNESFRTAFSHGRSMYFDDREYEVPHVAHHMNTLEAVGSVLDEDGKGGYCFDRLSFKTPIDLLGFFLGYMSGPIIAESEPERKERHSRVILIPEEAL
ncbi:MAG TPA: hypothetical protein VFA41_19055 [Ktedonobacteraceae bacterium]|jgi:hypothetical protein|nr:hypothetical protein [Ktedonobacteraceae bacterium]